MYLLDGFFLWYVVVHGSVDGVFEVIPVGGERSAVRVVCKKVVAVLRQVLFDHVFVGS